jgi:hypothetical protein
MNIFEDIIEGLFIDVIWFAIRGVGAGLRWLFVFNKFTYQEIFKKDWNGALGLFVIIVLVFLFANLV